MDICDDIGYTSVVPLGNDPREGSSSSPGGTKNRTLWEVGKSLEDTQVKAAAAAVPAPVASQQQTELSMGPVEKKLLLVNLVARPPALREKKREKTGTVPVLPTRFQQRCRFVPRDTSTPNPSNLHPSLSDLRMHTHHLGAYAAESDDERSSRRRMGTSHPHMPPERRALLTATTVRPSLRSTRPEVQQVRLALRRAPWPPYWEPASRPPLFAASAATPLWSEL